MKAINLARPAIINDLLRYPVENPITVTEEEADRQKTAGNLVAEDDKKPAPGAAKKEA